MKTSIIIPNWNGKKLLEKNLPSILATNPDEVIIVDNFSEDDSVEFLKKNYPELKILAQTKNLGFAKGCNLGVKASTGDIVILLNSDVIPEKDCLKTVKDNFIDSGIFAMSFNEPQWSWSKIVWKRGFFEHEPGEKVNKIHLSAWASGGSAAFRKSIWEELGGFDTLYEPFYWEDIDLSYRAWKRGYKVIWDPKAIVHHKHEGTIGKHFSKEFVDYISRRNQLIFIWKNIDNPMMILEHKLNLLWRLKNPRYWKVMLGALIKFPQIIKRKIIGIRSSKVSDKEIFNLFKD